MGRDHLDIRTSMVANRGRNNPKLGSFSFFESIYGSLATGESIKQGDFFLGYFTRLKGNQLILDQNPKDHKLLIEIIAWDQEKGLYNFYELRGIKNGLTQWFYRGNSKDAYKDNTWLYREVPEGKEHFGNRMRCSACHNSGGPIFKENLAPHNDWWTKERPLTIEPNIPNNEVFSLIEDIVNADNMAKDVQIGANQLANSSAMIHFHNQLTMQEQLRPLFCTTEINIESNVHLVNHEVLVPSAFWINPLLDHIHLSISVNAYNQMLERFDMNFPETPFRDADHLWHTPVKGEADLNAIKNLIQRQIINQSFARAVLMVDFPHPLFSSSRCELLKLIPNNKENWFPQFLENLRANATQVQAAAQLYSNLTKSNQDSQYQKDLQEYEQSLQQLLLTKEGLESIFQRLIELRSDVYTSELSQNPLGQILEPGFRVIFPESKLKEVIFKNTNVVQNE